ICAIRREVADPLRSLCRVVCDRVVLSIGIIPQGISFFVYALFGILICSFGKLFIELIEPYGFVCRLGSQQVEVGFYFGTRVLVFILRVGVLLVVCGVVVFALRCSGIVWQRVVVFVGFGYGIQLKPVFFLVIPQIGCYGIVYPLHVFPFQLFAREDRWLLSIFVLLLVFHNTCLLIVQYRN